MLSTQQTSLSPAYSWNLSCRSVSVLPVSHNLHWQWGGSVPLCCGGVLLYKTVSSDSLLLHQSSRNKAYFTPLMWKHQLSSAFKWKNRSISMTELSKRSSFMLLPQGSNNGDRREQKENRAHENSCNYFLASHHYHFAFGSGQYRNAVGWPETLWTWAASCLAYSTKESEHNTLQWRNRMNGKALISPDWHSLWAVLCQGDFCCTISQNLGLHKGRKWMAEGKWDVLSLASQQKGSSLCCHVIKSMQMLGVSCVQWLLFHRRTRCCLLKHAMAPVRYNLWRTHWQPQEL